MLKHFGFIGFQVINSYTFFSSKPNSLTVIKPKGVYAILTNLFGLLLSNVYDDNLARFKYVIQQMGSGHINGRDRLDSKLLKVNPYVPSLNPVVFNPNRDGGYQSLFMMSHDTGKITRITTKGGIAADHAAISKQYRYSGEINTTPDGKYLSLAMYDEPKNKSIAIVIHVENKSYEEVWAEVNKGPWILPWSTEGLHNLLRDSFGYSLPLSDSLCSATSFFFLLLSFFAFKPEDPTSAIITQMGARTSC